MITLPDKVYAAVKGKVFECEVVNETPMGWRVRGGQRKYEHVVFKDKQRVPHISSAPLFYREKTFVFRADAVAYANEQIISLEQHHTKQLERIQQLREDL